LSQRSKTLMRIAILFSAMIALPACAKADAGVPMIAFSYPIMVCLLVFVVLIEAAYFRTQVNSSWRASLVSLGKANLLTTLVGFPMIWLVVLILELAFWFAVYRLVEKHEHLERIMATPPGQLLTGALSAAWLGPTNSKLAVTAAFVALLLPAFFVSAWLEAKMVARCNWNENATAVKRAVWQANMLSYLFLAVFGVLILRYQFLR
jgi:hypothetical protein